MNIRIKKLWLGKYASLRDNWIRDGIRKGGLGISYLEKNMFLNVQQLESVLLSTPSQIISSKYKGKYKLYDVEFGKKDPRQTELFQRGNDEYKLWHKTIQQDEIKLWRSVIKRAVLDCCGIFEDSKFNARIATRHRIIFEAESWFNKKDDFYEVCSFANMQPNDVFDIKEQAKKYFKDSSEERSTLLSALLDRLLQRYY